MKYYATVTCRRVIELNTEDYESAVAAADQQIAVLLPEREQWKAEIDVSAVRGMGELRYYVRRVTPTQFEVHERQLEYQNRADIPAGIHDTDPLIRSFGADQESAHYYAQRMSELQNELDKRHGRWTQHAVTAEITGEGVA